MGSRAEGACRNYAGGVWYMKGAIGLKFIRLNLCLSGFLEL
jgi:hypothetical protein